MKTNTCAGQIMRWCHISKNITDGPSILLVHLTSLYPITFVQNEIQFSRIPFSNTSSHFIFNIFLYKSFKVINAGSTLNGQNKNRKQNKNKTFLKLLCNKIFSKQSPHRRPFIKNKTATNIPCFSFVFAVHTVACFVTVFVLKKTTISY